MSTWIVAPVESGQKLSIFLKSKLGSGYSARRIKQAVEHNACRVNGRVERFVSFTVGKGDRVAFEDVAPAHIEQMKVLFQDEYLLACDKPAGISSEDKALMPQPGLELLHRLDKDTTGVLLWAKQPEAAKSMFDLFKKRQIKKTYWAVVDGLPKTGKGRVKNQLGKLHQYHGQSLWGPVENGEEAITDWHVEKRLKQASLLVCHPLTGRTHQIRVHLSGLGHPILGDKQYGKRFQCAFSPSRCLLHAYEVEFIHPFTQSKVQIIAPPPADFVEAVRLLGLS